MSWNASHWWTNDWNKNYWFRASFVVNFAGTFICIATGAIIVPPPPPFRSGGIVVCENRDPNTSTAFNDYISAATFLDLPTSDIFSDTTNVNTLGAVGTTAAFVDGVFGVVFGDSSYSNSFSSITVVITFGNINVTEAYSDMTTANTLTDSSSSGVVFTDPAAQKC